MALAQRVASDAKVIRARGGNYMHWRGGDGEELWLQVDAKNELIGMQPHFAGESSVRIGLHQRVRREDFTALDGAFRGWVDPESELDPSNGTCELVFDVPDAATAATVRIPSIAAVQLTAFAQETAFHTSSEAYEAWNSAKEVKFASRSFVPAGLFDPHAGESPQAQAFFTGHVLRAATKKNAITGASYYWALVDSLGGAYDVVIDPRSLEQPPSAGGVLSGSFWMSGRLTSHVREERNWWAKIFRRSR